MYGWPVLIHHCPSCDHNTAVEYSPAVWTDKHNCNHCGHQSPGADIQRRSQGAMTATQHDELARLFAQQMTFSAQQQQQQQPQQVSEKIEYEQLPVHFASAHYTQSAHIRSDPHFDTTCTTPPPPYSSSTVSEDLAELLRQNSIDPSSLLPAQIDLFQNAAYEQRLRLLELWRIAPPTHPLGRHVDIRSFQPTSLEKEEAEARTRYETIMQQREQQQQLLQQQQVGPQDSPMQTGGLYVSMTAGEPISPIREPGEPAWPPAARLRAASIASRFQPSLHRHAEAEPYIISGYAGQAVQPTADTSSAASQQAVDPVYAAARGMWQAPDYAQAVEQAQMGLADQYGAYDQIRNHADWERMNEEMARERFAGVHQQAVVGDEDMVM